MNQPVLESSVSETLNIVGDFWMLRIVSRLLAGARTWGEIAQDLGASSTTLAKRLRQLGDAQCVKKIPDDTTSYRLTPRGQDLFTMIAAMDEWKLKWDNGDGLDRSPWNHICGAPLRCSSICTFCSREITRSELDFIGSEKRKDTTSGLGSRHFRSAAGMADRTAANSHTPSRILQIFGDRRTSQVVAALSRGTSRFDDILNFTRLHPAVLSNRLRKLQLIGLAFSRLYQENPDRLLYGLLPEAQDMVSITMQMMQWGDRWIFDGGAPPVTVMHRPCGERLIARLICRTCQNPVTLANVVYTAPQMEPLFSSVGAASF